MTSTTTGIRNTSLAAIPCFLVLCAFYQVDPIDAFVAPSSLTHQTATPWKIGRRIEQRVPPPAVAFQCPTISPSHVRKYHRSTVINKSRHSSSSSSSALQAVGGYLSDLAASVFRVSGTVPFFEALGINAFLFFVLKDKLFTMLTPSGFLHAMALGTGLWNSLGWRGWTFCVLYLFLGQLVTKVRFADKEKRGLAESRGGRRGPENVWGSAATGLFCAICSVQGGPNGSFLGIPSNLYILGYVASLSTKLADTFASEIGKAYGKTTFLITNLKRVAPGTEGAVSLEGTVAAAVGGLLLSLCGLQLGFLKDGSAVVVSAVAAFLATNVESLLGATLQEKEGLKWMTNEVVNFINTAIGAAIAIAGGRYFLGM